MKNILFFFVFLFLICTSLSAADRRIAPARMGKMGTPHPAAWKTVDTPEVEGKGEVLYSIEVLLYKDADLLEKFSFTIKPEGKDSKSTKQKLIIDGETYEFGTTCKLSLSNDSDNLVASIDCKSKIFDKIIIIGDKKSPQFKTHSLSQAISLSDKNSSFKIIYTD